MGIIKNEKGGPLACVNTFPLHCIKPWNFIIDINICNFLNNFAVLWKMVRRKLPRIDFQHAT
jgi:hypothetical protein